MTMRPLLKGMSLVVAGSLSLVGGPSFAAIPHLVPNAPVRDVDSLILAAMNMSPPHQTVDTPDNETYGNDGPGLEYNALNRMTTRKIVLDLRAVVGECSTYDDVYRIDCLRQGLDLIADSLPKNSEYVETERVLRQASRKLAAIVSENADTSKPKLKAPKNANPRFKKTRSYAAIRKDAVPRAMEQATAVIEEAKTTLLRASENSERRYLHYQQISTAVDSTKVLLRS